MDGTTVGYVDLDQASEDEAYRHYGLDRPETARPRPRLRVWISEVRAERIV